MDLIVPETIAALRSMINSVPSSAISLTMSRPFVGSSVAADIAFKRVPVIFTVVAQ